MNLRLPAAFLALALFGAGCDGVAPAPSPSPETEKAPRESVTERETKPNTGATPETPRSGGPRSVSAATTDATWQMYTNKNLAFSFQWPTRGRYAPEWEVKLYPATDAAVTGGCFAHEGGAAVETVLVGETSFCHTQGSDNGAGQHSVLDSFATTIGKTVAVIHFSKQTVNAGALDNCSSPSGYSTSATSCIPFDPALYQETLDGIVGTFSKN